MSEQFIQKDALPAAAPTPDAIPQAPDVRRQSMLNARNALVILLAFGLGATVSNLDRLPFLSSQGGDAGKKFDAAEGKKKELRFALKSVDTRTLRLVDNHANLHDAIRVQQLHLLADEIVRLAGDYRDALKGDRELQMELKTVLAKIERSVAILGGRPPNVVVDFGD